MHRITGASSNKFIEEGKCGFVYTTARYLLSNLMSLWTIVVSMDCCFSLCGIPLYSYTCLAGNKRVQEPIELQLAEDKAEGILPADLKVCMLDMVAPYYICFEQ